MEIENIDNSNLSDKTEEIIKKIFNGELDAVSETEIDVISESDEQLLPEPKLPPEYTDTTRVSLSDSNHYQKHLETHWGF
jgi:hypothetical protein